MAKTTTRQSRPDKGDGPGNTCSAGGSDLSYSEAQTALELALAQLQAPDLPVAPVAVPTAKVIRTFQGQASWYGPGFYGNRTANGEVFRPGTFTAAHRSLPFGTKVLVTNMANGKSAMVRINDRGPFHGSRMIDLAHGAARELGVTSSGIASVKLQVIQ
jgi:rare lipoprotein A